MSGREYVEITESFACRRAPETAIEVFLDDSADRVWIAERNCFETRSAAYILAWLQMAPQHVLVITCVTRHWSQNPLPE